MKKSIRILGTRGIPAQHGGFETFAQQLALYLVNSGWEVIVYCQSRGEYESLLLEAIDNQPNIYQYYIKYRISLASASPDLDYKESISNTFDTNMSA